MSMSEEYYPEAIKALMEYFRRLPGIGRRGAERLVSAMLEWPPEETAALGQSLCDLHSRIGKCPKCGSWAEHGGLCRICSDPRRDASTLCVVETMAQLVAVESSGKYFGRYLVLGGRISPLDDETGEGLNLKMLRDRAGSGEVKEVILALSSDVEGRATAVFLSELLAEFPVKITRPAQGLPAGANLSYADAATIGAALAGRTGL